MCGNGIRCVAKYLVDRGLTPGPVLRIETGAGVKECQVQRGADGFVETVIVDMGAASFARERIPMRGTGEFVGQPIEAGGKPFQGTAVSMGNPHLVLFAGADLGLAEHFGPLLEHHPDFPERTNVGFAGISSREALDLVVYERGSGVTRACGTGACAAVAAGVRLSLLADEREVRVNLPGGTLHVRVAKDFSHVWMRGPATLAFRGETVRDP
jgi:diaminopimelate epimerase